MLERQLTSELHRVADAAPVPDGLFPAGRLKRGGARQPWAMVAAAAVALLALGFSPLGQKAVDAATQWVMTYRVKVSSGPAPVPDAGMDPRTIRVGETVEVTGDGGFRYVRRGVAVDDLSGWPLPTYLAPDPTTTAVLSETYAPGREVSIGTSLTLNWQVNLEGDPRSISYSVHRTPIPASRLEEIRSGKRAPVEIFGSNVGKVGKQTVTIKGQEATAVRLDNVWSLRWWHEGGSGALSGILPLEELLKVAESLPSLE